MVPRLPGSRTASSASHRASAGHGRGLGLARPALLEHAEHGLRVVLGGELGEHGLATPPGTPRRRLPPSRAARDATPACALPARNTSICGTQPASRAVTSTEAPSATNRPVSRRTLRISSERMSFTRSFCRLVMARVAAARGSGRGIARGPAREDARSAAAARPPPRPRPARRSRSCPDGRRGIRAPGASVASAEARMA